MRLSCISSPKLYSTVEIIFLMPWAVQHKRGITCAKGSYQAPNYIPDYSPPFARDDRDGCDGYDLGSTVPVDTSSKCGTIMYNFDSHTRSKLELCTLSTHTLARSRHGIQRPKLLLGHVRLAWPKAASNQESTDRNRKIRACTI